MASDQQPRVLLATLYERTSARGNRYLSGRLGAARVIAFLDTEVERSEGTQAVWNVFVTASDDTRQRSAEGSDNTPRQDRQRSRGSPVPRYASDPARHPDRPSDRSPHPARDRGPDQSAEPSFSDPIPF